MFDRGRYIFPKVCKVQYFPKDTTTIPRGIKWSKRGQGSFLVKAIARNQKPGLCLSSTTSQLCGPEQESCFQSQVRINWDKVCESALHLVDAQKTVVPSRILKKAK